MKTEWVGGELETERTSPAFRVVPQEEEENQYDGRQTGTAGLPHLPPSV
jgi:hypothetical protein